MICKYCFAIDGHHDNRCPNYIAPKSNYYCSVCNEGIYGGERYIENSQGDFAHWDCICGMYDLADFLEIEIKEMNEDDLNLKNS